MSLLRSAVESLRARVRHLESDWEAWRARAGASGDLAQHHTQIERVTLTLEATLSDALGGTPVDPATAVSSEERLGALGALPGFRRDIGTIHLLWEFFRDKFAQRDVDRFRAPLDAADDLAWACYQPCLDAAVRAGRVAGGRVKEPPLVFYAPDRTPFAKARTKTFQPEGLDAKDVKAFTAVLMSLPVPLIGIPWEIGNRLPDLVLVGHEAGHIVAEDLRLAAEARETVRGAMLSDDTNGARRDVWVAWTDEIFADVFGVVATGKSFASALTAELAADADHVRTAPVRRSRPGAYPTPPLRVALVNEVLSRLDIAPPSDWSDVYRDVIGDSRELARDVPVVAAALLERSWTGLGGETLTDLLPWGPAQEADVARVAQRVMAGTALERSYSARVLVAAAGAASRVDAERYAGLGVDGLLAERIIEERPGGVRSVHVAALRATRGSDRQSGVETREADEEIGARIAEVLKLGRHSS